MLVPCITGAAASQSAILAAAGSTLFEHVVGRALAVALLGYAVLLLVAVIATATRLPLTRTLLFNPTATAEAAPQVGAVMLLLMLLTFPSAVARRRVLGSAGASGEVARGVGPHLLGIDRDAWPPNAVVDEWTEGRLSSAPAITIRTVPGDLGLHMTPCRAFRERLRVLQRQSARVASGTGQKTRELLCYEEKRLTK